MKKTFALLIAALLMFGVVFTGCAQQPAAEEPAATESAASEEPAATESSASEETAASDDKYEIVLIAKVEGIAWFDDTRVGVEEFAATHADVKAQQIAPEAADSAQQIALIEDCIARGVDAITIIPVDPDSLTSVIKKARDAGIVVITHEGSSLAGTADYDMEAFDNEAFGALYGENLAQAMGGKGKYLGMVGSLTMQTHNVWYQAAVKHIKENYPDMELVAEEPYEDGIDSTVAYQKAQEIMKAYPDLGGVLTMTVEGGGSFAKLLKETNNTNVKISTLAIPSSNGNYIAEGWISYGQCWRPADAAYVMCNIAYKMLQGEAIEDGVDLEKDGYNSVKVVDGIIYGDAAVTFTKDNIADYNF